MELTDDIIKKHIQMNKPVLDSLKKYDSGLTNQENWEEGFDKEFVPMNKTGDISMKRYLSIVQGQKSFIRHTLSDQLDRIEKAIRDAEMDGEDVNQIISFLQSERDKRRHS